MTKVRFGHSSSTYLSNINADTWVEPAYGLKNYGGVFVTNQCPLKCAHCIRPSSPEEEYGLNIEVLKKYAEFLSSLERRTFFISGGEPLLRKHDTLFLIKHCHALKYESVILETSAFWARTKEVASKIIHEIMQAGLTHLYISTDEFHQRYVPYHNIKYAIDACRNVSLKYLVGIISKPVESPNMRRLIEALCKEGVIFRIDPVVPFGRGTDLSKDEFCYLPRDSWLLSCSAMGLTLGHSGIVYACCNNHHPVTSELHLGKYLEETIVDKLDNRNFIELVQLIEEGKLDSCKSIHKHQNWRHQCEQCIYFVNKFMKNAENR